MSTLQRLYAEHPFLTWVARVGLFAGLVAVGIAWWATIEYRYGVLFAASAVATLALIAACVGHLQRRVIPLLVGLILVGLAAPTSFAFLGNLLALVAAAVVLAFVVLAKVAPVNTADEEPDDNSDEGPDEDPTGNRQP